MTSFMDVRGDTFSRLCIAIFGRNDPPSLVKRRKSFVMFQVPNLLPRPLLGRPRRNHMGKWFSWPFVRIGEREWYWPTMLTLWRKGDKVTVQFSPWQHLRRWLFTRCEFCGGRFKYGTSCVSTLNHMHSQRTKSVFWGETGCYHFDCPHDPEADRGSTEGWDRQWGHDIYLRQTVLYEPVDVAFDLSDLAKARREADLAYRKRFMETRKAHGLEPWEWKFPRPHAEVYPTTEAE